VNSGIDELRRRLHDAFDGEQPRPGVVDDIVQKARAGAVPRRVRHLRAMPLLAAVAIPVASVAAAVALGLSHHGPGNGTIGRPAQHAATPSVSPLPTIPAPAHFVPWQPLPVGSGDVPTPTPYPVPPGTPACRAAQLEGAQLGMGAAAGNEDMPIVLRNRGTTACVLQGFADLRLLDARGQLLAEAVGTANRGTFFDDSTVVAVLMQPGTPTLVPTASASRHGYDGQAFMNVQWTDCSAPQAHAAAIDLPDAGGRVVMPFPVSATQDAACFPGTHANPRLTRGPFRPELSDWMTDALDARIAAPSPVRAGSTVTYYVTLTNHAPLAYRFDPCPDFGEGLDKAATIELRLNCAAASEIAPGSSETFEMRVDVPRSFSGTYQLTWNLLSPGTAYASAPIEVLRG
jgi:hypothetical protein